MKYADILKFDEAAHPRGPNGRFTEVFDAGVISELEAGHTPLKARQRVVADAAKHAAAAGLDPIQFREYAANQLDRHIAARARVVEKNKQHQAKVKGMRQARLDRGGIEAQKQRDLDYRMAQGRAKQKAFRAAREQE